MRGVAVHFRARKPAVQARSGKGGILDSKQKSTTKQQHTAQDAAAATTPTAIPADPVQTAVAAPTETTPRARSNRNRLKTPPAKEIEQIIADIDQNRAATPPPPAPDPTSPFLLGTPPRRRTRAASPAPAAMLWGSSSPTKRKARDSDGHTSVLASPTKAAKIQDVSSFATTEPEEDGAVEEEDGLVLTPGRNMGTRIALGSPKTITSSPLAVKSPTASFPRSMARRLMEDEDDLCLTPRAIREKPKGSAPPTLLSSGKVALFKTGHDSRPSSLIRPPSTTTAVSARTASILEDPFSSTPKRFVAEPEPALPDLKHQVSSTLPLPTHYSSIMTLHMALEHALLVHLATSGASTASLESNGESDNVQDRVVRLPNLITYTALRPLVERSGGRRLGPTELKRLASVWTDFQLATTSSEADVEEVRGLGFIVSKTRALDSRTGRRVWDWGIGIELEIRCTERPKTPPMHVGFGGVATTPKSSGIQRFTTPPPSSPLLASESSPRFANVPSTSPYRRRREQSGAGEMPSSPQLSSRKAREGMSLVAMWNNGLEVRKAEVGRRLRERCARFHQLWLDGKGIAVPEKGHVKQEEPATPSRTAAKKKEREVLMGEGGLLTPSATRSGGHRVGGRTIVFDQAELDRAESESEAEDNGADGKTLLMDELNGKPSKRRATVTASDILKEEQHFGWTVPSEGDVLAAWHPEFDIDNPKTVRQVPSTELPALKETAPKPVFPSSTNVGNRSLMGLSIQEGIPMTPSRRAALETPSTPSTPSMSLKDRIRAKEEAKRTNLMRKSSNSSLSSSSLPGTPSKSAMMAHFSRRATLSRLPELASILFMLFPTNPRPPTLSMSDVLTKLSKSTKTTMSKSECRDALDLLNDIVPGFLEVINVGGGSGEWVKLGRRQEGGSYWALQEVRIRIGEALHHRD